MLAYDKESTTTAATAAAAADNDNDNDNDIVYILDIPVPAKMIGDVAVIIGPGRTIAGEKVNERTISAGLVFNY